ncbi:MAG: hypothetical protein QMD21_00770 [Candidatus Thermoplasmatota archaeon]|nr:hypothetical protein [Candidatus Thermoplasmatota archaeon]
MAELYKPKLTPKRSPKEIKERFRKEKKRHAEALERLREARKIELEKVDATIEDAILYTDTSWFVENFDNCYEIKDLWATRPKLYGDTDVIAVTLKPSEGKPITDIFPVVLRFDGTLEPNATSRRSRIRRKRLESFLKHYKITDKIEGYSIPERMKEWKKKKVKVVTYKGQDQIFIPNHLVRYRMPKMPEKIKEVK